MALKSIITCDLCGAEKTNDVMHTINILVKEGAQNTYINTSSYVSRHADWCDACCVKMGVKPPPKGSPAPAPPSMEDMVRAIV